VVHSDVLLVEERWRFYSVQVSIGIGVGVGVIVVHVIHSIEMT
jgi:hypothetical protein